MYRILRLCFRATLVVAILLCPGLLQAGFSVDEGPNEVPLDPGDVFFAGLACDIDDGDGSCPPPSLNVPDPTAFDMDAFAIDEPVEVCPVQPPFPPGILFSFDDGDPGPGVSAPDNFTEIFFYDHCAILGPRRSYHTALTESVLGLGADPPPAQVDDDVDAYETRPANVFYQQGFTLLFSPDTPSDGALGPGSEAHIWFVNGQIQPVPAIWAMAGPHLGVPDPDDCDIDGIAPFFDESLQVAGVLFTTDANAPCGLDPGDIYWSDTTGSFALYADDVADMRIAAADPGPEDIDALAVNDSPLDITDPYDPPTPPDPTFYKADWPNYAPSGMPDFSQFHAQWPPTFCGPVAVWNSLWWFDSEMECESDRTTGSAFEIEPNDTCDRAIPLGETPPIPGVMGAGGADADWFRFEFPGFGRTCTVNISTCAHAQAGDVDTTIGLFDGCSSGTPGPLLSSNDNGCLPRLQSDLYAQLEGGRPYYVQVQQAGGPIGSYTLSLGIDCYPMIDIFPGMPDDHSEYNTTPYIPGIAMCMNTDDVNATGTNHRGTLINDMQACIDTWLQMRGLDVHFTEVTVPAPPFHEVEEEIERSEDIVLLLGFYWQDPQNPGDWNRCGGHYVTAAGVDSENLTITLSDPGLNNAEPPPSGSGGAGRVRGPLHVDHAPAFAPPPDHDDTQNVSHDLYTVAPSLIGPPVSDWRLIDYATAGTPTLCADVRQWCMNPNYGQNPIDPFQPQQPCPIDGWPVTVEVEAMVDVSPHQTPICIRLDPFALWPDNLRIDKGACQQPSQTNVAYDVLRGKLCNLRFSQVTPTVDLGHTQCLYDDTHLDQFDELGPDDTTCMGCWFYLIREHTDAHYGRAAPGLEVRVPSSGGCP
ncbi:MAG: hypothetical protein GY716_03165 [bacterium]|nr:hypothetical protein [bacterium]